ncbi:hypothetical protein HOLleu_10238 [Holothuria leucospilota]|uniref:Uncharacterized protein n=1 Tax=Holothuria leucospilota TaxID=206669 RepID=A0A9Q1CE25_HOLLE|nr:hypothetical protein HOLleu_10238 [Holothuria leucospilota]
MLKGGKNCLHSDATTKWHKHYQGFQMTTPAGKTLSIGMDQVASGSTDALLEAFNNCIEELSSTLSDDSPDEVTVANLISTIKYTMSDQGPINPSFNKQLQDIRAKCLSKEHDNWESLPEKVKEDMVDMGNFFCKMHILVNFATEADKALKIFESHVINDGNNPHTFDSCSESGSVRLIRTACKALTKHGSDKSGVASYWNSFLSTKERVNKLVTFRGNRFNIVFYDAAAVFYHLSDIEEFLTSYPDPNKLLQSVHFDCKQNVFQAGVKALAITDKLITGPMWSCIEAADSILDLNEALHKLQQSLEKFSLDASTLLQGQETFFDDNSVHKDTLFESIFSDDSDDEQLNFMTQMALELILKSFSILLDRQAKDQL